MNKKDLASFKRQLKNGGNVIIDQICRFYIHSESKAIVHQESAYFAKLSETEQELYFQNFKKILTGGTDEKLFELPFKQEDGACGQSFLYRMLRAGKDGTAGADGKAGTTEDDLESYAAQMIEKINETCSFEMDFVVNFIRCQFTAAPKKVSVKDNYYAGGQEIDQDGGYSMDFLLCSINRIQRAEAAVKFEFSRKQFSLSASLSELVDLKNPVEGFMFPTIAEGGADVNKVVYYSSRSNSRNLELIEQVLNADVSMTAEDEKERFDRLVSTVVGEKAKPELIKSIYESIDTLIQEEGLEEEPRVSLSFLEKTLSESGVDTTRYQEIAREIVPDASEFKAANIIPKFSKKSLVINTDTVSISISPKHLDLLRTVIDERGRKCIQIEVEDDVEINGILLQ